MKHILSKKWVQIVCAVLVFVLIIGALAFLIPKGEEESVSNTRIESVKLTSELPAKNGYISFLGDSITTYEGWSNNPKYNTSISGNDVYYTSSALPVTSTYWHKVAREFGFGLCVNNSWNGARVTDTKEAIPDGKTRAAQLHNDVTGIMPDVVIIYLGTNDLAASVDVTTFEEAYMDMLEVINAKYSNAEVYCCTLLPESRNVLKAELLEEYNETITTLCESFEFNLIDFNNEITDWDFYSDTLTDNYLRVHPNENGMDKLADCVIKHVKG